jgi:hypothetical protein
MRITISHNRTKEQVIKNVDRTFDDFFKGVGTLPLQIVNEERKWIGSTLNFSFSAKMGVLSTPVKGTVLVGDRDVTIDADFGLLEKLLGTGAGKAALEGKVRGLLT